MSKLPVPTKRPATTGDSPAYKVAKIDALAEFLKGRFRLRLNATVEKTRVIEVIRKEYDPSVTGALAGRAVSKAFGSKVHNKGRKLKDVYTELQEYRAGSIACSPWESSKSRIPIPTKSTTPVKPRLETTSHQSKTDSSFPSRNINMLVTSEEATMLNMVRNNDTDLLPYLKRRGIYSLDTAVLLYSQNLVRREVEHYRLMPDSILRQSSAVAMESFSLKRCYDELSHELPGLMGIVKAASIRTDIDYNIHKDSQSLIPAVTTIVAKCLALYSDKLSALRTYYSLLFSDAGVKDESMNRFAKLYDCTTHQSILPKINILAKREHVDLSRWEESALQFGIVFDNVDILMRPRRESSKKANTMYHMVQAMAVQERVKADEKGPPLISIDNIKPSDVMVSSSDSAAMKDLMVQRVVHILAELPGLAAADITLASEKHQYSEQMSKPSPMVNLGVLMKNENVKEELLVCLRQYHELVGNDEDGLSHKLCIGDYLSFERGLQVINSQSDGSNPSERLEGLIMACADFHVQMNFLKLAFKLLYHADSQHSVGTLTHAKDFLNARNVTADPTSRYYDCGALFDKVFKAYLITVAAKQLGVSVKDLDGDGNLRITGEMVQQAAERIVDNFVDLTVPNLTEKSSMRCSHCRSKFANRKNLRRHHLEKHPHIAQEFQEADGVYNHTCAILTLGLMRSIHNRAIQLGNGQTIMLLYKFLFVMFKGNGSFKYGCGLLETIIQTKVLPKHLSDRLMWNRFYNRYNRWDSNIPLDLQMEHENRLFKANLKSYRGTYTQDHIDRISKGRSRITAIVQALDRELGYHRTSGRNQNPDTRDIKLLSDLYSASNLTEATSVARYHSLSLMYISKNLMEGVNGKKVND